MIDLTGKEVKVGDFVIPFVSHTYRMTMESLFGIVISDYKVFTYNSASSEFGFRDCVKCLKLSDTDFDGGAISTYKKLVMEYQKLQAKELSAKVTKPKKLELGQVYKKVNPEYKSGTPIYYIYLGEAKLVFSNKYCSKIETLSGKRVYLSYDNNQVDKRADKFEYMLKNNHIDNISFTDLLFNKFLDVDISFTGKFVNHPVFINDLFDVRDRAITGVSYIKTINITDFNDSDNYAIDTVKWSGGHTRIYKNGSYTESLDDFVFTFKLLGK